MDLPDLKKIASLLQEKGVTLEPGLTDDEVAQVEGKYGFRFPPDLRSLLQLALPVSEGFPDWRNGDEASLRARLDWPADGICFDIEHNTFWFDDWGHKPATIEEAQRIARQEVAKASKLIPVYGHRYIPDEPHLPGNPIFSVYQTDIIYYVRDLVDYFDNEFSPEARVPDSVPRTIRFWDDLVRLNNEMGSTK